jgi:hypothetical protein
LLNLPEHAPKLQDWVVDGSVVAEHEESVNVLEYWSTQVTVLVWTPPPHVAEHIPQAPVDHEVIGHCDVT